MESDQRIDFEELSRQFKEKPIKEEKTVSLTDYQQASKDHTKILHEPTLDDLHIIRG